MLECTPAAAATLEQVRKQNSFPEDVGVRLSPAESPDGQVGLSIDFTRPADGDQVTHQHGTTLIVAPEITDQLSELTLDLAPDATGNGNEAPQLVLRPTEGS